ncbi:MAG: Fic family protein [Candidatus Micrarchaeota archaeon]|nr:Fic family protein [Candidatus Micrarchaeota archaeon]MDE1824403.1 Fic family protein [Candidatus Micrarchaeota archaeon]MDE1849874.1 Fic family protein [Candidatus Micrarchaeota archaeon]
MQEQNEGIPLMAGYLEAFNRLGIENLLRASVSQEDTTPERAMKAIFYSNTDEDTNNVTLEELLLSNKLISKDGDWGDSVSLLKAGQMQYILNSWENKEVTPADIVELRRVLLSAVFQNSKYADSTRRYRITNGTHVTPPVDMVDEALREMVKYLNKKPSSLTEALFNAAEFHAQFIGVHPFEDGNGRTSRLVSSWYLLSHGLNPIHVKESLTEAYTTSTHAYYISLHRNFSFTTMLMLNLVNGEAEELVSRAAGMRPKNAHELEVKDTILWLAGRMDKEQLKKDVVTLYNEGMKGDRMLAYGALWLSLSAKVDTEILAAAYKQPDVRMRNLAIYAMGVSNFSRYKGQIEHALFNDKDQFVREQAIFQLGYQNKALPLDIFAKAIEQEKSNEMLLIALGKNITYTPTSEIASIAPIKRLMEIGKEMGSVDVQLRAYQALMAHADTKTIVGIARNELAHQEGVIKKEIIVELSHAHKLNTPEIAAQIAKVAKRDDDVLKPLLGELTLLHEAKGQSYIMHPHYVKMNEGILNSRTASNEDRAYATYLLGRESCFMDVRERYGITISDSRSTIENMAVLVTFANSFDRTLVEGHRIMALKMLKTINADCEKVDSLYEVINMRSAVQMTVGRVIEKHLDAFALLEVRRDSAIDAEIRKGLAILKGHVDRILTPANQEELKRMQRGIDMSRVAEPKAARIRSV